MKMTRYLLRIKRVKINLYVMMQIYFFNVKFCDICKQIFVFKDLTV